MKSPPKALDFDDIQYTEKFLTEKEVSAIFY